MLLSIPELIQKISPDVRRISAEAAFAECAGCNGGVVIDVRQPEEVQQSPVAGSINIPRGVLEMQMSVRYPDVQTPIYIHCATGARATLSAEQLQRIGYENVTVIGCAIDAIQGARGVA